MGKTDGSSRGARKWGLGEDAAESVSWQALDAQQMFDVLETCCLETCFCLVWQLVSQRFVVLAVSLALAAYGGQQACRAIVCGRCFFVAG